MIENIQFHIETFQKELEDWQRRFKLDNKDRWFIHYTIMSEKIKEKATVNLNPTIQEFKSLKETYGEKYRTKDLTYHVDAALTACEALKKMLKELYDLYKKQAEYEHIRSTWQLHFPTLFRRINHVKERIYILDRILAAEKTL